VLLKHACINFQLRLKSTKYWIISA